MIYLYECDGCGQRFDVVKPVADYDRLETCPTSGTVLVRVFTPTQLYKTAVEEREYSPALGRAVTRSELAQEAKRQNWIEVGTERVEKHVKPIETEYPSFSDDDIRALTAKP